MASVERKAASKQDRCWVWAGSFSVRRLKPSSGEPTRAESGVSTAASNRVVQWERQGPANLTMVLLAKTGYARIVVSSKEVRFRVKALFRGTVARCAHSAQLIVSLLDLCAYMHLHDIICCSCIRYGRPAAL